MNYRPYIYNIGFVSEQKSGLFRKLQRFLPEGTILCNWVRYVIEKGDIKVYKYGGSFTSIKFLEKEEILKDVVNRGSLLHTFLKGTKQEQERYDDK
jgi:hypothetical protein